MRALSRANMASGAAGPEDSDAGERLRAEVARLSRRHRELLRRRAPWEGAWRSLAEHFLPTRFRPATEPERDGEERGPMLNSRLVDATGILAMRVLAAGLQGGLTSPARPWFRLSLDDAELARSRQGQEWLDECAARMRVVFHRSNFYNVMHTLYAELGTFGTAFAFELADPRWGFSFVPLCAGELRGRHRRHAPRGLEPLRRGQSSRRGGLPSAAHGAGGHAARAAGVLHVAQRRF